MSLRLKRDRFATLTTRTRDAKCSGKWAASRPISPTIRKARGVGAAAVGPKVAELGQTIYAIEAGNSCGQHRSDASTTWAAPRVAVGGACFRGAGGYGSLPDPDKAHGHGQAVRVSRVGRKWVSVPVDAPPHHFS